MELKNLFLGCISLALVLLVNFVSCDVEKDREKCGDSLVGLATCLPYVSGEAKAPPSDCCTGFRQVLKDRIDCVCLLIKDRDDPSLGLKINATLALSLPAKCNTPLNGSITDCPAILHLPPNSPDAKVFEDFAKSANKSAAAATAPSASGSASSTSSSGSSSASATANGSDGGKKKKIWLEVAGLFIAMAALLYCEMISGECRR